jgi:hypothetical protein
MLENKKAILTAFVRGMLVSSFQAGIDDVVYTS